MELHMEWAGLLERAINNIDGQGLARRLFFSGSELELNARLCHELELLLDEEYPDQYMAVLEHPLHGRRCVDLAIISVDPMSFGCVVCLLEAKASVLSESTYLSRINEDYEKLSNDVTVPAANTSTDCELYELLWCKAATGLPPDNYPKFKKPKYHDKYVNRVGHTLQDVWRKIDAECGTRFSRAHIEPMELPNTGSYREFTPVVTASLFRVLLGSGKS
ncbi:hypothetical protein [Neptuniibacter sp. QD37_11]|uniref:hypothetical protein n=1 Tax=Neptuniibacter sp. QD37_11 TaxID=3398209 RepID=UPI0039F4AE61